MNSTTRLLISLALFYSVPTLAKTLCRCSGVSSVANLEAQAVENETPCLTRELKPNESFWLHCKMDAPTESEFGSVLQLGRIADDEETYFNGALVGSSRTNSAVSSWNYFLNRTYFVPKSLIKASELNDLKIRVISVTGGLSGLIDGPPVFGPSFQSKFPKTIEVVPALFLLFVVSIFSVFRTATPKALALKGMFVYGGILTSVLLFLNSFYLYRVFPNWANLTFKFHIFCTVVTVFVLYRYSELLLDVKASKAIKWVTLLVAGGIFLLPGIGLKMEDTRRLALIFVIWGIPIILYGSTLVFRSLKDQIFHSEKLVWPFLIGATALLVTGGWDLSELYNGRLPVAIPISGMGFFVSFFMAAVSFTLIDRRMVESALEDDVHSWRQRHDDLAVEAAVGRITRQVAHDIRSPLSVLGLLGDPSALTEERKNAIALAVERIRQIADDLLVRGQPAQNKFLPYQIVDSVIVEKSVLLEEFNVDFQVSAKSKQASVEGNPAIFARIVSNILDNAVHASKEIKEILISVSVGSDRVVTRISDKGVGIAADALANVGKKGFSHGKSQSGGQGLGLHNAIETIESWGGEIKVLSASNSGTTIEIYLPAAGLATHKD